MHAAVNQDSNSLVLEIKVVPGSSKNAWIPGSDEVIRMKIAAAPEDGKANAALVKFIAQSLGCRKAEVSILSGEHSRVKRVRVPASVMDKLEKLLS